MGNEMLEEKGLVIAIIDGQKAQIKVQRSSSCEHCVSHKICHDFGPDNEMLITINNPLQAKVGQEVLLALPGKTFLRASLIVYLIPVIALFAGAIIGQRISETWSAIGAIIGLVLSFWGIWLYNKHVKPETYMPTMARILDHP